MKKILIFSYYIGVAIVIVVWSIFVEMPLRKIARAIDKTLDAVPKFFDNCTDSYHRRMSGKRKER